MPMTNPKRPARQVIRETADANGWTWSPKGVRHDQFIRGDVLVTVESIQSTGAVAGAERFDGSTRIAAESRGKRETVLDWLTALPTEAEITTASPLDEVPAAELAPIPLVEPLTPAERAASDGDGDLEDEVAGLVAQADEDAAIIEGLAAVARRLTDELERTGDALESLTRRAEVQTADYRVVRARVTELEDQRAPLRRAALDVVEAVRNPFGPPAPLEMAVGALTDVLGTPERGDQLRTRARKLVEALAKMRGTDGMARVSFTVSRAWGLLADELGMEPFATVLAALPEAPAPAEPTRNAPLRAEFAAAHARGSSATEGEPTRAQLMAEGPGVRAVLEVLGIDVRRALPGEAVTVWETYRPAGQPLPLRRTLGMIQNRVGSAHDHLWTDEGRDALHVPVVCVAAYVAGVRELPGLPVPRQRRAVARRVAAEAGA